MSVTVGGGGRGGDKAPWCSQHASLSPVSPVTDLGKKRLTVGPINPGWGLNRGEEGEQLSVCLWTERRVSTANYTGHVVHTANEISSGASGCRSHDALWLWTSWEWSLSLSSLCITIYDRYFCSVAPEANVFTSGQEENQFLRCVCV